MSEENVEIVRRAWVAWSGGDLQALFSLFDAEVEWDASHFDGWTEQKVYRGHDEVRRFFEEWLDIWADYEAGVEELIEAGDRVIALCWQRGTGKASGAVTEMDWAQITTIREGKITHVEQHFPRDLALKAAGLSE